MGVRPVFDEGGAVVGVEVTATAEGSAAPPNKAAYDANVAALDVLARQAARVAKGNITITAGNQVAIVTGLAEAVARMWFHERYGDEGND